MSTSKRTLNLYTNVFRYLEYFSFVLFFLKNLEYFSVVHNKHVVLI
jgi:hypothetical protein